MPGMPAPIGGTWKYPSGNNFSGFIFMFKNVLNLFWYKRTIRYVDTRRRQGIRTCSIFYAVVQNKNQFKPIKCESLWALGYTGRILVLNFSIADILHNRIKIIVQSLPIYFLKIFLSFGTKKRRTKFIWGAGTDVISEPILIPVTTLHVTSCCIRDIT